MDVNASAEELARKCPGLGAPEEIKRSLERLDSVPNLDLTGEEVRFSGFSLARDDPDGEARVLAYKVSGAIELVGGLNLTREQWLALKDLVDGLLGISK